MRVFIAEKPTVARAIAAVLPGPQKRHKTYIQSGDANVVVWCAGHILTQYMPEDYDPRYKRWSEADLPIIPSEWRMNVAPRTKDLYQTIKRFVGQAALIVHAGDPGGDLFRSSHSLKGAILREGPSGSFGIV